MTGEFVHLHCHTEYSLLDGAARIEPLVRAARELEMPALAITDHGVMYGVVDFYKTALKYGIKPIIGCEVYLAPRTRFDRTPHIDDQLSHLVLLAENDTGYRNLMHLVSLAHLQGFYYKPRIDLDLLQEHGAGLIALSGCLAGQIPTLLYQEKYTEARNKAGEMRDIFGRNFYLEVQDHGLAEQKAVNPRLLRLGQELNLPVVATNDLHYIRRQDAAIQDILLCIQTGKTQEDPDRSLRFTGQEFYLKSAAEMHLLFGERPHLLQNTLEIAEKCQVKFDFNTMHLPDFAVPPGYTQDTYLVELCYQGMRQRYPATDAEARAKERLDYELRVIQNMDFAGYFLIVQDLVNWAKSQGIFVGPGRGSAAGSLVAYVLGITNLDPLKYDLLFERFLNPQRVTMPDIDIDFCYQRRDEVIAYVIQKYGEDHVSQIITFGTMLARSAIRDVGRVLGMPLGEVDRVAKMIPEELGITIEKSLEVSTDLRQLAEREEKIQRLLTVSQALEGMPRHASTHAAGLIIGKDDLMNFLPLQRTGEAVTSQFPKETVEEIGLLKMDILGLRTLTVLNEAILIARRTNPQARELSIETIPPDDPDTYALLGRGETIGVFQLESPGLRSLLREMQPNCFEDLIALNALYRPGPLGSGMVEDFIRRKKGLVKVDYPHPALEAVLKDTYGVIVYQEQVMRVASELAGFTLGEADELRRAMSKKKPEVLAAYRNSFVEGAAQQGVPASAAEHVFDLMEYFAGYGFNRSHSAAYALIAYQTAYLKAHFPTEYMAALLTSVSGNLDKAAFFIEECRRMGLKVLLPDINESRESFTVIGRQIRFGLAAIKQLGGVGLASIIAARREGGPFASLLDFCARVDLKAVNRRVIENLVWAGAFDSFGQPRSQLLQGLDQCLEYAQRVQRHRESGQLSLFDFGADLPAMDETGLEELGVTDLPEFPARQLLEMEKEVLGLFISGHPLDEYAEPLKRIKAQSIAEAKASNDGQRVRIAGVLTAIKRTLTKKGETMAYLNLEDLTGSAEVIIFPRLYQQYQALFDLQTVLQVGGRADARDEGPGSGSGLRLLADRVAAVSRDEPARYKVYIRIPRSIRDRPELNKVTSLLKQFPGPNEVYLYFVPEKRLILTKPEFWVQIGPDLQVKMEMLCGPESFSVRQA